VGVGEGGGVKGSLWAVAALCGLITLGLGLRVAGESTPTGVDLEISTGISAVFREEGAFTTEPSVVNAPSSSNGLLRAFLLPTEPVVLVPVIAGMALWCARARRWDDVLLCTLGTALPVALNTWVLKPLFDRSLAGYLAYPSGHTVSLVSTLTVLVLLARPGRATWTTAAVSVTLGLAAGIGLVGSGYHYPTDVLGGACFAVAAVVSVRALRPWRARSGGSPPGGTSSGSPPAASPR
jgi:PAP2 superfamily